MSINSYCTLFLVAIFLSVGQLATAQTFQTEATSVDHVSAREAYLKRQAAFTERLKFTASQKEQYEALIEKRNAGITAAQTSVKQGKSITQPQSAKQVLIDFQRDFDAMLTEQQRSVIAAEKATQAIN